MSATDKIHSRWKLEDAKARYLGKAGFVVSTVIETMAKFAVVAAQQGDSQFKVFKDPTFFEFTQIVSTKPD